MENKISAFSGSSDTSDHPVINIQVETTLDKKADDLLELIGAAQWTLNANTRVLEWSHGMRKLYELQEGALPPRTFEEFTTYVHTGDRHLFSDEWDIFKKHFSSSGLRFRIITPDRKVKSIRSLVRSEIMTNGHLLIYGVDQDISSLIRQQQPTYAPIEKMEKDSADKGPSPTISMNNAVIEQANRNLLATKTELRTTLRKLEIKTQTLNQIALVLISDIHGIIQEVNRRFLEVTGYEEKEIIGTPDLLSFNNIFHSGIHSYEFLAKIKSHVSSGHAWSGEICKKTKSGKLIWLLETIMPLKNDLGEIEQFYFFNSEITQLKDREEIITQEKRVAQEDSRIKEEFLSLMSHEIRTPLNSIIGLTTLLLKRNPREDQIELVETLKNSSDNLLYLVNNILDYHKLRAGNLDHELTPFNLHELIQHIHKSSGMIAREKDLDWSISLDPTLPAIIRGDRGRLNQILNNLIHNAIKFTPGGFISLHVSLLARVEKMVYILFEVNDTGIGITEDQQDKIFNPFFQGSGYSNQGTGLGLSIVKKLVEVLKGTLQLRSSLGKGSTFSIELPFEIPSPDELKLILEEQPAQIVAKIQGCRVLYVEDVESNRFLIHTLLTDHHVDITTVSSGEEALLLTDSNQYDIILMDLQMPGLDGYHTVEAIRKQVSGKNLSTPVIAFTAKLYSQELVQALVKFNIQDVIVKPFDVDALLEKIAHAYTHLTVPDPKQSQSVNFTFYEIAMRHNKEKLGLIKEEILRDMRKLAQHLMIEYSENLEAEIHQLIHRLQPVVSNLKLVGLKKLLNTFQQNKMSDERYNGLAGKILSKLNRAIKSLEELSY